MNTAIDQASATPTSAPWYDDVTVPWMLAVLVRDRRVILSFATVGLIAALGAALLRPSMYTATFSFIPQSGSDQGRSGLASIAGQFGIALGGLGGQSQPPQLYADLIKTREVLANIARDTVLDPQNHAVPLSEFLHVKGSGSSLVQEKTIRVLRNEVVAAGVVTKATGVVAVSATTRSPAISLRIAQELLDGLNQFNLATRKSQATEERRFTEGRLQAARTSLRSAEDALQSFLQGNRQLGSSPQLGFQRQRLEREVALQQQVVTGLAQQYEDARIREVRDTPVITLIERPTLPVIPDPSGRALTVILGTVGMAVLGCVYSLVRAGWERQRVASSEYDPSYAMMEREWRGLRKGSPDA